MAACHRAFDTYHDAGHLEAMRRAAMARSFGWAGAAAEYEALYRRLLGRPLSPPVGGPPETAVTVSEEMERAA